MHKFKFVIALCGALVAGAAMSAPAAAAPMMDPFPATTQTTQTKPEQVRWVCNAWGRCWWRPNYYAPRFYGGPYYRRWGYRRGWGYRRWRRW